MGRACGYRILLQTAKLWGRGPHFASDGHILLQMTASRFRRPHFASDGRILLRTILFRFRWPRFASDSRILLWTAAFCFGGQRFASHSHDCLWITTQSFREKSILHCAMNSVHWHCRKTWCIHIQWDVFISPLRMLLYIFSKGQSPFWTAKCDVFPWIMSDISPELVGCSNSAQKSLSEYS